MMKKKKRLIPYNLDSFKHYPLGYSCHFQHYCSLFISRYNLYSSVLKPLCLIRYFQFFFYTFSFTFEYIIAFLAVYLLNGFKTLAIQPTFLQKLIKRSHRKRTPKRLRWNGFLLASKQDFFSFWSYYVTTLCPRTGEMPHHLELLHGRVWSSNANSNKSEIWLNKLQLGIYESFIFDRLVYRKTKYFKNFVQRSCFIRVLLTMQRWKNYFRKFRQIDRDFWRYLNLPVKRVYNEYTKEFNHLVKKRRTY